jgi:N-methylhydantoinase A
MTGYAIAVDIGGTFTDVVLRHKSGRFWIDKTLTTAPDLQEGFFEAVHAVLDKAGTEPKDVDEVVVHATTVVTNAIIERKGPKTALIVTEGFRDVLSIRDECRSDIFDNQIEVPAPLIPDELTFTVAERTLSDGTILQPVDEKEVRELAGELAKRGIESVAVCFLNSYRNEMNERHAHDVLLEEMPDLYLSLSADVAPQMREYPRASTTALNAYTMPIVLPYFRSLGRRLKDDGFSQDLLVMLSSGGVISAEIAGHNPVRMIESGPAAGALAAGYFSSLLGISDLISFDMGGTTAKACFIQNGTPLVTGTFEVDRIYRFQQGSGLPVTVPCIDMIEIGAGGGSIAAVDGLGLLSVGPRSAGSDPGPVCYGRGGTQPTVTDADLVLGMLDADNFLGGEMALDKKSAERAAKTLGEALDVDAADAAAGIYEVVGESMASAIRAHATDRGVDWRGVPLLAFGGAGPVHACYVAELLESTTVIYPPMASVLSAFGTLVTPVRLDLVRSDLARLGEVNWKAAERHLSDMTAEGRNALLQAGCTKREISVSITVDMRYEGQHNELTISVPEEIIGARDEDQMRRIFEKEYERSYGVRLDDVGVEVVSWRVSAFGPPIEKTEAKADKRRMGPEPRSRAVRFPNGIKDTPVHARADLASGRQIDGPAIIEERETTIVILPGWSARIDAHGCIFAQRGD